MCELYLGVEVIVEVESDAIKRGHFEILDELAFGLVIAEDCKDGEEKKGTVGVIRLTKK